MLTGDSLNWSERTKKHIRLATKSARIGFWLVKADWTVEWDDVTYDLYGVSSSSGVEPWRAFRAALTREDYVRGRAWLEEVLAGSSTISSEVEFHIRRPDGSVRKLKSEGIRLEEESGVVALGVNMDITEQSAMTESLLRTKQELSALSASLLERELRSRKQLAYELHDVLGQNLVAMRLSMRNFGTIAQKNGWHELLEDRSWRDMSSLIADCFLDIRTILEGLQPQRLLQSGIVAGIKETIDGLTERIDTPSLRWISNSPVENSPRYPDAVEYAAFMIFREALNNAIKHSNATTIVVLCINEVDFLRIEVTDNGRGFSHPKDAVAGSDGWGIGMLSMRERAKLIDGTVSVTSPPNGGAQVRFQWQRS
jgi:signal transduction histidine kinase